MYRRAGTQPSTQRVVFSLRDADRDKARKILTRQTFTEVKRLTVEKAPSVSLYHRMRPTKNRRKEKNRASY